MKKIKSEWVFTKTHMVLLVVLWPAGAMAAEFDCLIEPMQVVEVSSAATGLLEKVSVKRGDRVSKGQIVASLESSAEAAATELARFKSNARGPLEMATSKIEFSQRKFSRRKEMANENLGSKQDSDDAEAELQLARSELVVAQESREQAAYEFQQQNSLLNLRSIRSPFDGIVVDQLMYPGEIVESGGTKKVILKLAQLDPLKVRVILPVPFFGRPKIGMSVNVVPELPIGGKYVAIVKSIDKMVDAASGSFAVFLEMQNKRLDVPSGVKCKASFGPLMN